MTDEERRAEENRRIVERMQGVPAVRDPFAKFDPQNPNVQDPNDNDNKKTPETE